MALVFTIDDDQKVLELVDEGQDGLRVRDGGDWIDVDTSQENPTIFEQQWVDAADAALDFWDNAQAEDSDVTIDDIKEFRLDA